MTVTFTWPQDFDEALREAFGSDVPRAAREALIIEGFRTVRFSIGQVAKLLGTSIDEAYGFMKARGVHQPEPSAEEWQRDREGLERLLRDSAPGSAPC